MRGRDLSLFLTVFCTGCFAPDLPETTADRLKVPAGTIVRIASSETLIGLNRNIEKAFEAKYPGTNIVVDRSKIPTALEKLRRGEVDIVALGRSPRAGELPPDSRWMPVTRSKIAIIVGRDNPFRGSLTARQVAEIYAGKITDWSRLGGPKAPLRFIETDNVELTSALIGYGVFRGIRPGKHKRIPESSLEGELDAYSISYVSADRSLDNPRWRGLNLFGTPVSDFRYPFSYPRYFIYKNTDNPSIRYFLSFVNSDKNLGLISNTFNPELPDKNFNNLVIILGFSGFIMLIAGVILLKKEINSINHDKRVDSPKTFKNSLDNHPIGVQPPIATPKEEPDKIETIDDNPPEEDISGLPSGLISLEESWDNYNYLSTVDTGFSRILTVNRCFNNQDLTDLQLLELSSRTDCITIDRGKYEIKLAENYGDNLEVLLWVFGGKVINHISEKQTGRHCIKLHNFNERIVLEVLETSYICGLFFDLLGGYASERIEVLITLD